MDDAGYCWTLTCLIYSVFMRVSAGSELPETPMLIINHQDHIARILLFLLDCDPANALRYPRGYPLFFLIPPQL